MVSHALATPLPPSPGVSPTAVLPAGSPENTSAGLARGSPVSCWLPWLTTLIRAQVFEVSGFSEVLVEELALLMERLLVEDHFPADGMPVYYVKSKLEFLIYTTPKVLSTLAASYNTVQTSHLLFSLT